mmetsp:Transcript_68180/g.127281  ORF Transcript_68180/g.127281 Transcript_68180/m.127281 type:complete len:131 (-) Transcript_68180:143-535(-)
MGCTSSSVVTQLEMSEGLKLHSAAKKAAVRLDQYTEQEGKDFHSGTCTPTSVRQDLADGLPLPPDMKMTREHRRELNLFLKEIQRRPVEFVGNIEWARESCPRLNCPEKEVATATCSAWSKSDRPSFFSL